MDGVVNEVTNKLHKQEPGGEKLETVCGHTYYVAEDNLRTAAVEQQDTVVSRTKCGRCFDDGGGY